MDNAPRPKSPLDGLCTFGPRPGYSPQISLLVSQLDWMRQCVIAGLHTLTQQDLDWLPAPDGNTIGAQLLHLAAAETYYQCNTFQNLPWPTTSPEIRQRFGPAMMLGDTGRRLIHGHDIAFYLDTLKEVRSLTLAELRQRDDDWLMAVDETWGWGPTNNFCKWFHVCEHESHHLGQIGLHLKALRAQIA
jgi:hypothetical protein